MKTKQDIEKTIQATTPRSAWERGVKTYALELLEEMDGEFAPGKLLNGAKSWSQYSYGGGALIYDCDIAERLCPPSVLKRKRGGELPPNSGETWIDCQTRALSQAERLIARHAYATQKEKMDTHTQGKWHVGKRAADIAIYGEKGEEIAKTLGFFNSDEENNANARLIAAAPELLAHLEMLVFGIAEGVCIPSDGAAIAAAREAIRKARGEA